MKYDKLLEIDQTDKLIVELLQENPDMTHSEIADRVHKSQPAVGARIIKLKRKHIIKETIGADFKELELKLARIDLTAKNVEDLWERFSKCPHITNCFKMTGEFNLMIEIIAPNIGTIESFIDTCLRTDPSVNDIRVNYIIDSVQSYIVPLRFSIESYETNGCSYECGGHITQEQLVNIIHKE